MSRWWIDLARRLSNEQQVAVAARELTGIVICLAVGERLAGAVLFGHWKRTTFVAALRRTGLDAAMAVDGSMDGDLFVAYTGQVLVPTLRAGDVVLMDNLSAHKRSEARCAS